MIACVTFTEKVFITKDGLPFATSDGIAKHYLRDGEYTVNGSRLVIEGGRATIRCKTPYTCTGALDGRPTYVRRPLEGDSIREIDPAQIVAASRIAGVNIR